ncbi:hypothetical protein C8R43DRAFT_898940, partial [Mycena crocata]
PPAQQPDPLFGQEELASLSKWFITTLFNSSANQQTNRDKPYDSLTRFIAYVTYRMTLDDCVAYGALLLLERLKERHPAATGASGRRLFLTAYIITAKVLYDETYSTLSWTTCLRNLYTVNQINKMEREMYYYLDWNLTLHNDDLVAFQRRIHEDFDTYRLTTALQTTVPQSMPSCPITSITYQPVFTQS